MQVGSNHHLNSYAQNIDTLSESPLSPGKAGETTTAQQAGTSKAGVSSSAGKARQLDLLKDIIKRHTYEAKVLPSPQASHDQNVDKVHEQVKAFIDEFVADHPDASAVSIRNGISENIERILRKAQLDIRCYQAFGERKAEYGKYLIFSSLSVPQLKDAPLCFQLFHFAPGQTTPIHNHPNPDQDSRQAVLVECASYVVDGSINERLYDGNSATHQAEKTGKEYRDAGSRRAIDNPGKNPPHSIKNVSGKPTTTVHAYTMDGISEGQAVAVQSKFVRIKNPESALYKAYDALIKKIGAGGDGNEPVRKIAASDLQSALNNKQFGPNPVIVDIRESKEVRKEGAPQLHIQNVNMLHAPRGVAIANVLKDFPDRNAHLILACHDGARSVLLADELRSLGYKSTAVSDGAVGLERTGLAKKHGVNSHAIDKWDEGLDVNLPVLAEHVRKLKSDIAAISVEELKAGLEKETLLVFDVRQESEQSSGVIPNAQRVPAGEFEKKARFHAHDFSTPVVIYSGGDSDYRSLVAAKNLMAMGYSNVKYLEGGYKTFLSHAASASGEGGRL